MNKIKKACGIHEKEEGIKILEEKLCSSKESINQSKLDQWFKNNERKLISEWYLEDKEKWI